MNLVSRKLAARTSTHQIDALYACNRIGSKVDAEIDALWRKLLRLLAQAHKRGLQSQQLIWSYTLAPAVAALIKQMHDVARANLRQQFTRLVKWGHRSAANVLASTLPIKMMKVVARRPVRRRQPILLLEDDPGAIMLQLGIGGELQATDRLGRLREPVRDELSDEEQRELLQRLLFPSLSQNRIADILLYPVAGLNWQQDLTTATKLADPFTIANILGSGFAAGKQPREVAKLLEPAVQGVKSTARRVARTYGMQIAHRAQMDAHAAVADLIVGYQVHATLDHVTRSWHAARSGTIYYLEPKPGQKGPQQMPHPPLEAEDLRERPPGTPRLAPNCRCFLAPVLTAAEELVSSPEFQNAAEQLIPDPLTYSDWFERADEAKRRLAVGSRRYATMKRDLHRQPSWEHFVDPDTGRLLELTELQAEEPQARAERVRRMRELLAQRGMQRREVARLGFLKG